MTLIRLALAGAVLLALAACGKPAPRPAAPAKSDVLLESGWSQSETPTSVTLIYQDGTSRTDFSLACAQTGKVLRVLAPNPVDAAPPQVGEHASLVLGPAPFEAAVSQTQTGGVPFLMLDIPVTPPLLIALGDAKTARVMYRDGSSETGVDEDGKIVAFAQACARLTGVAPAL